MAVGDDRWELVIRGLPEAPAIRAIATHPEHAGTVYVGTQHGPYRSTDHGEHWERLNISDHGLPVWSLLFDPRDSEALYAGYENCEIFRSKDGGERWQSARLEPLNPKGQTYCRDIREVPGDPKTIWVAAGSNFQSDVGVLFRSKDGGSSWTRVDMGVKPKTTMFSIAFDERQPKRMYCATTGGHGI